MSVEGAGEAGLRDHCSDSVAGLHEDGAAQVCEQVVARSAPAGTADSLQPPKLETDETSAISRQASRAAGGRSRLRPLGPAEGHGLLVLGEGGGWEFPAGMAWAS